MGARVALILCGVLSAITAVGCGSSHSSSTSSGASVVTTAPSPSTAPEPAIAHRLLNSSELPSGLTPNGQPSVATSAQAWLRQTQTPQTQLGSETTRLKRLGFVAGATENLQGSAGAGLSLVEEFQSSAAARSELANEADVFKVNTGQVTSSVSGIPKAIGLDGAGPGGGVNVAFADGDYYYLVGEAVSATAANKRAVLASAQKLYRRVHA